MSRAMKDSGIPWIGEIPEVWESKRFKYSGSLQKGKLPQSINVDSIGLPIIGASEMIGKAPRQYSSDTGLPICKIDDTLILWDGANAGLVASQLEGIVSSTAAVFSCTDSGFCSRYVFYLLKCGEKYFRDKVGGTTIPHMNPSFIDDIPMIQPSVTEQRRIVNFLDIKCGEIDDTIALQEGFISELKAYKQSVITEAVTRGLNPNVKFKDSGIDWIGKIPQGWKCEKVKHIISSITSGVSVNAEQIPATDKDLGVLKTSSVSSNYFIPTENKKVDVEEMGRVSCPVKADTIIVSRMNTPDLVGSAGYCKDNIPNLYLPDRLWQVETIKDRVSAKYLWRFLISLSARYYYSSLSQGTSSSMQNISQSQFESAFVPVPPLTEQKQIADFLDNKCTEIDSLIAVKQQKIEELKDYKKSVIYEYVTGKKEVNG